MKSGHPLLPPSQPPRSFYRYVLRYRGEAPLEDAYLGWYVDFDLGNFNDDYVGSDSLLRLAYVYNADEDDEGHYGSPPPASGVTFLKSPPKAKSSQSESSAELDLETGLSVARRIHDPRQECEICGPRSGEPEEFHLWMKGRWVGGSPMTVRGEGYRSSEQTTRYQYPGDPVTGAFWSEENVNGTGEGSQVFDRRLLVSSGPFRMEPGEEHEFVVAIIWSRGEDRLDSVRKLRDDAAYLYSVRDDLIEPVVVGVQHELSEPVFGFAQNYPNPFSGETVLRYSLRRSGHVELTVFRYGLRRPGHVALTVIDPGYRRAR